MRLFFEAPGKNEKISPYFHAILGEIERSFCFKKPDPIIHLLSPSNPIPEGLMAVRQYGRRAEAQIFAEMLETKSDLPGPFPRLSIEAIR
ncbi:MAG: hypothetical protein ACE5LV_02400 [Candidatus Aminicenantales bacterium]